MNGEYLQLKYKMKRNDYIVKLNNDISESKEIIKLLLWDLRNKDFEPTKDIERAEKFLKRDEE